MWLIAGPNGSGKSTIVENGFLEAVVGYSPRRLNPDVTTQRILERNKTLSLNEANLQAAQQTDAEVDLHIERRDSFVVETVLSSNKFKPRVERAKSYGFKIGLVFVTLLTAQDSIDRVRLRKALGGHPVEDDKVRERWEKSLSNLPWFAARADLVLVFDNSPPGGNEPVLLASKEVGGQLRLIRPGYHPRVDAELKALVR